MSRAGREYKYPLRLPGADEPEIAELVKISGQSINSILVQCIRKGLPLVRQALYHNNGRVTVVNPLARSILERIYDEKDELSDITAEQLAGFQIQHAPE